MARDLLSNLSDWDLVYDEQDIRGHDVYDDAGNRVGTVRDLVADTDRAEIVALVLDDGREVATQNVEIGGDRVLLHSDASLAAARTERTPTVYADAESRSLRQSGMGAAGATYDRDRMDDDSLRDRAEQDLRDRGVLGTDADDRVSLSGDDGGARPISDAGTPGTLGGGMSGSDPYSAPYAASGTTDAGVGGHTPSGTDAGAYAGMGGRSGMGTASDDPDRYFREHYERSYGSMGASYDDYAPAYRSGFDYGGRSDYQGRDYDALEPDLRRDYEGRYGEGTWDRFKDAVRHGFDRARNAVTGGDDDRRSTPY